MAVRRSQAALRQMSMKRQSTADMICSAEISAHSVVNGIASRLEPGGVAVVGKQTVAEAAAHLGSHLQLYTGETESDEDTISAAERDSQLE